MKQKFKENFEGIEKNKLRNFHILNIHLLHTIRTDLLI